MVKIEVMIVPKKPVGGYRSITTNYIIAPFHETSWGTGEYGVTCFSPEAITVDRHTRPRQGGCLLSEKYYFLEQ